MIWIWRSQTGLTRDGLRQSTGLPLFGGAQLAIDATIVSTLRGDGSARRGASVEDGVALTAPKRRKERRYPELVGPRRARLVVAGVEVGGRRSHETKLLVSQFTRAKARQETCCAAVLNKHGACGGFR